MLVKSLNLALIALSLLVAGCVVGPGYYDAGPAPTPGYYGYGGDGYYPWYTGADVAIVGGYGHGGYWGGRGGGYGRGGYARAGAVHGGGGGGRGGGGGGHHP